MEAFDDNNNPVSLEKTLGMLETCKARLLEYKASKMKEGPYYVMAMRQGVYVSVEYSVPDGEPVASYYMVPLMDASVVSSDMGEEYVRNLARSVPDKSFTLVRQSEAIAGELRLANNLIDECRRVLGI